MKDEELRDLEEKTDTQTPGFVHVPVLSRELLEGVVIVADGHYLDATVGAGGHSSLLLALSPGVRVTAIDRDEQALATAKAHLAQYSERVNFWRGNYAEFKPNNTLFDGIIADLGVSSGQLDTPARGFSFRHKAELDMRMDCRQSLTAAEIINHWDETELANIFYTYGEERLSRRLARQIVGRRPFHTTTELADAISGSVPPKYRHGRIHPATRVFQALRIVVNQELTSLETFINLAPNWLKPGGRLGVISFHSLEDRIVKHRLRDSPLLKVLTKKPILPQADELGINPRSRSAKLRLAEKSSA
ncbi:16S rRNA (cytosine(1402)-N(4))-methyltransferase RsmH [Microcoleus sp. FACHB-672]|uniref:16S rRNA (cytosine(1402)-N(4))-methyltransferase RsmH n=1 Tax=Microcoleus sp. FACHB-672 TaxID=2692825 RepID=UPI001682428C|nr:16S rRNA (cytosine(1402)-N(4))-methyltransferase RsmH [Microcoleus sp. FACHB-672]MBD2042756.1 16S rRNA (cytosine(1402)-N(4))-methyltransferase RsmH [Microcoleus sp. FACHB-672]